MSLSLAEDAAAAHVEWLAADEAVGHAANAREQLLAAVGRRCFPVLLLGSRSKSPAEGAPWRVTTDAAAVAEHLSDGGNVGVVCGAESRVMVLDFDDLEAAREMFEDLGPLPLMVETGSGKWHAYFRHEPDMPAKMQWRGHRVGEVQRGPNQQVVAPPSIHPDTGRAYRWLGDPTAERPALPPDWRLYLKAPQEKVRAVISNPLVEAATRQPGANRRESRVKFQCPGCRAEGRDKTMDNAVVFHDGRYGCAVEPSHRDAIREALSPRLARRLVLTAASSVKPERVRLLGLGLPLGELSLLVGPPGLGKSVITCWISARVTRGQLDDGELAGHPRSVIVVATEDSRSHVIVPRLMAAGADLDRVFFAQVEVQEIGSLELSLPDDIVAMEAVIGEHQAALVVLDPLISRIGRRLDTHKDADVRQALEPLAALAHRTDVTILGVTHVNKTATTDPLNAVMGSRAFAAAARAVLLVVRDGDQRLLCFPKANLGPERKSRAFRIGGAEVAKDGDGKPITTAEVVWLGESDRSAQDVLEDQAAGRRRSSRDKAEEWLAARLKGGPVASREVKEDAEKAGIPERTLKRAARQLEVVFEESGFPRRSTWSLPPPPPKEEM